MGVQGGDFRALGRALGLVRGSGEGSRCLLEPEHCGAAGGEVRALAEDEQGRDWGQKPRIWG